MEDKGQLSLVNVLKNRKSIPDLNDIKSVGCYYYAGSTGISNRPFDADGYAFYLLAFGSGADSRVCQLAVETGGKIAARSCIGSRWSGWEYYMSNTDNTFLGKQTIDSSKMTVNDAYLRIIGHPNENVSSRAGIYFCNHGVQDGVLYLGIDGVLYFRAGAINYKISMVAE